MNKKLNKVIAGWWEDLSEELKNDYLKVHPNSRHNNSSTTKHSPDKIKKAKEILNEIDDIENKSKELFKRYQKEYNNTDLGYPDRKKIYDATSNEIDALDTRRKKLLKKVDELKSK